jgi:hypothetical protein
MFERYTEKARRVIFFARYEASQYGSPYIESEHLLLGLLRADRTLTIHFLRGSASVESIRKQVDGHTVVRESTATSVDLPLSNECKRILAYAAEEAERLANKHIGTEHLLLGILRENKCFAAKLLTERGLQLQHVRAEAAAGKLPFSGSKPPLEGSFASRPPFPAAEPAPQPAIPVRFWNSATSERMYEIPSAAFPLPAIGETAVFLESQDAEATRLSFRVDNVSWVYLLEKTLPAAMVELQKRVDFIVQRMENAIANHEFEKARFYSDEERKERETLRTLREQLDQAEPSDSSTPRETACTPKLQEVVIAVTVV